MRLITAGWVMNPTMRMLLPQRGHTRGSTSYTRRIISAHLRLWGRARFHLASRRPRLWGGLGRHVGLLAFAPGDVRIEAVVPDKMAAFSWDLHQDPGSGSGSDLPRGCRLRRAGTTDAGCGGVGVKVDPLVLPPSFDEGHRRTIAARG